MREDDQSYFEEPEFKASLEKYEDACRNGMPIYMDADELTDIAEYYMTRRQESRANEAISLAVQLHPQSVDPQIFLARQEMFRGNLEEAQRICDAIVDQNDREVVFLKAELLIRNEQPEKACSVMEEALEEQDSDPVLFLYDCACVLMDYSLWDEAMEWTERVLNLQPDHNGALLLKAEIMVMTGYNDEAIEILNSLLDQDPYNTSAWNFMGEAQCNLEHYQEAMECAEYVLAINEKNRQAMVIKANCLFHLDHIEEAHEMYKAALNEYAEDDIVCYLDAVCLINLNRYEEASEMLDRANEISGGMSREQFEIYMQQAHVENQLHNVDKAINAVNNARKIIPASVGFEYEFLMGHIYLENQCYEKAKKFFDRAIKLSKDKPGTVRLIGISLTDCKLYKEAMDVLGLMLAVFGDDPARSIRPHLAYCCYQLQEYEKFLLHLKEAIFLNREDTIRFFSPLYPNIPPEEYYLYAFKSVYGRFPEEDE